MDTLPPELLLNIFSHLDYTSLRLHIPAVCKTFNLLAAHKALDKQLFRDTPQQPFKPTTTAAATAINNNEPVDENEWIPLSHDNENDDDGNGDSGNNLGGAGGGGSRNKQRYTVTLKGYSAGRKGYKQMVTDGDDGVEVVDVHPVFGMLEWDWKTRVGVKDITMTMMIKREDTNDTTVMIHKPLSSTPLLHENAISPAVSSLYITVYNHWPISISVAVNNSFHKDGNNNNDSNSGKGVTVRDVLVSLCNLLDVGIDGELVRMCQEYHEYDHHDDDEVDEEEEQDEDEEADEEDEQEEEEDIELELELSKTTASQLEEMGGGSDEGGARGVNRLGYYMKTERLGGLYARKKKDGEVELVIDARRVVDM